MPKPFVSGRVPQKLFEELEAHCTSTGIRRSEVLIRALEAYLGVPPSTVADISIPIDQVLGLEEYVHRLVKQQVQQELQEINFNKAKK